MSLQEENAKLREENRQLRERIRTLEEHLSYYREEQDPCRTGHDWIYMELNYGMTIGTCRNCGRRQDY